LVTPDEVGDAGSLNICLRLNGQTMQQSNTKQLIFPIDQLISYVSGVCTLKVWDVLFTGAPPGGRHTGGLRAIPPPGGVPVKSTSPTFSVQ
ncbi:fumarylacetoacetate hydrolase family protein, partial [Bifidobacterium pullorum subsp. saeculare]|uniref:fumarylacetoacetate hydrolase family protein n=1 Tax=Bifidobacterium pullorum TaxID=78448 RepID=UPI0019568582